MTLCLLCDDTESVYSQTLWPVLWKEWASITSNYLCVGLGR